MQTDSLTSPSYQPSKKKDGVPPDASPGTSVSRTGRTVSVALNKSSYIGFHVCKRAIIHLKRKYPDENFPTNQADYATKKWRTNKYFTCEIEDDRSKRKDLSKLQTRTMPIEYLTHDDCWEIEQFTHLNAHNCIMPRNSIYQHFTPTDYNFYEKFEFDNHTAEMLTTIKHINNFPERLYSLVHHLEKEQGSEYRIKKILEFMAKESELNEDSHEIFNTDLSEEDPIKIILGFAQPLTISKNSIQSLKANHPEENFPDNPEDYEEIVWRTNKKLVDEVEKSIEANADKKFPFIYLKHIPRKMLDYPAAINIRPREKNTTLPESEKVILHKKKLCTKITLASKKELLSEITELFIRTLEDENRSADERLNRFYNVLPEVTFSEQSEADHLQPCKSNETGMVYKDNHYRINDLEYFQISATIALWLLDD